MRRCPECRTVYEEGTNLCPDCGEPTIRISPSERAAGPARQSGESIRSTTPAFDASRQNNSGNDTTHVFMQRSGFGYTINGAIAESQTQQYYQSKLTKIVRAVFSGEPYQLAHTSHATIFRVEEHVTRGYPENACDVTLYGNMKNIFAVGDDVTVTAKRKGARMVARRVYNHSINNYVGIQPNIPAGVIRFFTLLVVIVLINLLNVIINADYSAIGNGLMSLISGILPTAATIAIIWFLVKKIFRR